MNKSILTILIFFIAIATYCQKNDSFPILNLDFEIIEKGNPVDWDNFESPGYHLSADSTNVKSGK